MQGLAIPIPRLFNDFGGRKFVVTQSVKKLNDVLKQAVFNDHDYRFSQGAQKISLEAMKTFDKDAESNRDYYDGYIYKSIPVDKVVDLGLFETKQYKNGKTKQVRSKGTLKQRIIVTYSRKMAEYQKTVRTDRSNEPKRSSGTWTRKHLKRGPNDVTRFIKSDKKRSYCLMRIASSKRPDMMDSMQWPPTYSIWRRQRSWPSSQGRYKIEDCFKILKTHFGSRPVHHRLESRIKVHFLICYTALLIYRLLEVKLDRNNTHFTPDQILETLKNMNVVNCQDIYYQACYTGSDVLDSLEQLFHLQLDRKYYLPKH